MNALNHKEIKQAYNHFLTWFASLLLLTIGCIYAYMVTRAYQLQQLSRQKETFDRVFLADATLAYKVDSLYLYMGLLNTSQIQDDRQMQRLITRKKEELTRLVHQQQKTAQYFAVYNRLFGHVNEMLLLKDSLNKAIVEEGDLRDELTQCLRQSIEEHRQRTRSRGTGAF